MASKKGTFSAEKMATQCESVSGTLKVLSHPQRLMILTHLANGEKSVGELQKLCGGTQSHMSQFLSRMKLEGLLSSRREGTNVFYKIMDKRILSLLNFLGKSFCD